MEAVVVIYPCQGEVYETRVVGRSPGAMAASSSPEYLFVANTESGNVTVMDQAGKVTIVAVGGGPGHFPGKPGNKNPVVRHNHGQRMEALRPHTRGEYEAGDVGAAPAVA